MSEEQTRILIVDGDPIVADSLAELIGTAGHATATAGDGREALAMLKDAAARGARHRFGILVTELDLPRGSGIDLLKRVRKEHPTVVAIAITGFAKIESAVQAIKLGAVDYLTKPVVDEELLVAIGKAAQTHSLMAENQTLRAQLTERYGLGSLVGTDYRMQKVYDLIEAVADSKTTVLIEGESGTGKSLVGRAIHTRSPRAAGPFVTFACGSIPETLLESELFGHVKGAFTGADHDKPGKCLAADGGTLFIDEINSATPALQLKLLRVLQEKQFEPIGSTQTVQVDVRFVLATNEPLPALIAAGKFREDLYYRINVVNLVMPPLRERSGDIPLLAEHFLAAHCRELGRQRHLTDETVRMLTAHAWPGNVRELENAMERAVVLSRASGIEPGDLPETVQAGSGLRLSGGRVGPVTVAAWQPQPLAEALLEPERQILLAALRANQWNRQETARQLEINRTTLYKKIKHFRLDEPAA